MSLIKDIEKKLKKEPRKKIVLPESMDKRILKATATIIAYGFADVILIGNKSEILKRAKELKLHIEGAEIIDLAGYKQMDEMAEYYYQRRKHKPEMTKEKAFSIVSEQAIYFGAALVGMGLADGMVAGCCTPTGKIIKSGIYCVGLDPKVPLVSSYFIMIMPDNSFGEEGVVLFADCAVLPSPSSEQLADIAKTTAVSFKKLLGKEAKIALLSFSSKGSSQHEDAQKVTSALTIVKQKFPELKIDGELQVDAAVIPKVAKYKAPDSDIAGYANVLIFPDLDAGNICYKAVQRFGKAKAYGPILQGLNKPVNDLSRGSSVEDIINVIKITAYKAH